MAQVDITWEGFQALLQPQLDQSRIVLFDVRNDGSVRRVAHLGHVFTLPSEAVFVIEFAAFVTARGGFPLQVPDITP